MSGCTFQLTRNSPLRTTLVDEATGRVKYKVDTPRKIARSITRIRKLDLPAQPRPHPEEDAGSDSDIIDKERKEKSTSKGGKTDRGEVEDETETDLSEIDDEMARIYWKWFSPDKIVFWGGITTRNQFLPKAGKLKGWVNFRRVSHWEQG